ncbi:hypothetical protein ACVW1A_008159 [Bradyrhizobium sp. LB1.3]
MTDTHHDTTRRNRLLEAAQQESSKRKDTLPDAAGGGGARRPVRTGDNARRERPPVHRKRPARESGFVYPGGESEHDMASRYYQ